LGQAADKHRARGGAYIRPICLVQVERTGADQRGAGFVHAEDVKEHLIKRLSVDPASIAIKTSDKDELPAVDDENGLMSVSSPIRYIITKQALQEGWDCPFAYVLVVLSNPSSKTGMTQLLGRILRQPYARKTGVKELDESYVYCYWRAKELMDAIREGFKREGMGDLQSRVSHAEDGELAPPKSVAMRPEFKRAAKRAMLPVFVARHGKDWRPVRYGSDILRRIDWDQIDLGKLERAPLNFFDFDDLEITATLDPDPAEAVRRKALARAAPLAGQAPDPVLMAQQWLDQIPNPWRAYDLAKRLLSALTKAHGAMAVARNGVAIAARARRHFEEEVGRLAEATFRQMLATDELRFLLIAEEFSRGGSLFPQKIEVPAGGRKLRDHDDEPVQRSLFEYAPEDEFNDLERDVALFLDKQKQLFFWYRNRSRKDYGIQGWKPHRLYPDFIFATSDKPQDKDFDKIYVMETKGAHLKGNDKTAYLQSMLDLCTQQAKLASRAELGLKLKGKTPSYEVLPEAEWQQRLSELIKG
jgi:type III restriction enzyme